MGWDEALFGFFYKKLRRRPSDRVSQAAASLEPLRSRLQLFGSALAHRKLEIAVAEGGGHREGVRLFLPERLELAPDAALNERAYLVRVVLDASSLRGQWEPPRRLGPRARELFALLTIPALQASLTEELPGFERWFGEVARAALLRRPPLQRMTPGAQLVELLTRAALGEPWERLAPEVPGEVLARARAVGQQAPRRPEAVLPLLEPLAAGLGSASLPPPWLWGGVDQEPGAAAAAAAAGGSPDATGSERQGKTRENVRRVSLDDKPQEDNPLVHSFEKVHTVEEYTGGRKNVDGEDELAEHGEALDELQMREVVRSRERARSLYRAELSFEEEQGGVEVDGPPEAGGIPYDEWDERARSYRKAHCRVFVSKARRPVDVVRALEDTRRLLVRHHRQVQEVQARFERLERARRERGRQPDGVDVDIDVMVERHAALAAGHSGDDKLYVARRPHVQDLAVLVLLDVSLSSDAWVEGRRVLDVAKEAVLVLGEALAGLPISTGVATFFSNTRRDCRVQIVKPMQGDWQDAALRLASVTPTGYTRIGPALRHATRLLEEAQARRRLLIMVGDGKPTDFDRYEGRYGIADVRKAVDEAEQRGVHAYALAIDATARRQLPQMFGPRGYEVLARPGDLVPALGRLCAELAR